MESAEEYFQKVLSRLPDIQYNLKKTDEINKKIEEIEQCKLEISNLKNHKWNKTYQLSTFRTRKEPVANKERFFGHCPRNDCKGFINSSYECGICSQKVCKNCKEPETESHECNPDTVATIQEMKKNNKNCPKCSVSIFKIEGCNQMFCVQCNISFCWRTGEIFTRNIHNPHYFEWINRTGGNAVQPVCNDDIPENISRIKTYITPESVTSIYTIIRFVRHIKFVEIVNYNRLLRKDNELEYRIEYMTNVIDEKSLKHKLQRCDKRNNKYRDICQIYDTFVSVISEYLFQYIFIIENGLYKQITQENANKLISLYNDITKYTKESLAALSVKYKNIIPDFFTYI